MENGYIKVNMPKNCYECVEINGISCQFCKSLTGKAPDFNIDTRPEWCPIVENKKRTLYYAGIGSRETPLKWAETFEELGTALASWGIVLRSGGAVGADISFEDGCDVVNGPKEIYLPWKGFNGSDSKLVVQDKKAFEIAAKYHPYWYSLKQGAKKLQARNTHQVLGKDLNTKSDFVVCYTPMGNGTGGTGQAIRLATAYNIKIFDAGKYDGTKTDCLNDTELFKKDVLKFAKELILQN